jgi:DNA-directed RNA polymerase subunit RPC12/RpoP
MATSICRNRFTTCSGWYFLPRPICSPCPVLSYPLAHFKPGTPSFATPLPKVWLLVGFATYYAVLFFAGKLVQPLKKWFEMRGYRCPYCKSRYTIVLGLNNYLGDCPYYFYKCNDCGQESIEMHGSLVEPVKWKKLSSGK